MTVLDATGGPAVRRGPLPRALNLTWAGIYGIGLVSSLLGGHPAWVWVASGIALGAWILRALVPDRFVPLRIAAEAIMLVAGGLSCVAGDVLSGVPVAVAVILILGRPERPVWMGVAGVAVGVAAIAAGAVIAQPSSPSALEGRLLGAGALLVISILVAVNRRQVRVGEARRRELEAERLRAERLDDHAAVARELHDVLAHGLGGLVIQLDAVDALLESGSVEAAAARVHAARALAADALGDARRAVDALRADDGDTAPMSPVELAGRLSELIEVHRALGGEVDAALDPGDRPVPAGLASALVRALQEALSNARKHAHGQRVQVRLDATGGRLELTVANPVGDAGELAATGGGHGIAGMRERFAELSGGAVVAGIEGGVDDGRFTVRAGASR